MAQTEKVTDPKLIAELDELGAKQGHEGIQGIGEDISSSISGLLPAAGEMLGGILPTATEAGKYIATQPGYNVLKQGGLGAAETGAGILSAPQKFAQYLKSKFPDQTPDMPAPSFMPDQGQNTIYDSLNKLEEKYGLQPKTSGEQAMRSVGGMALGAKGLTKLPGMVSRAATIGAEEGGRGQNPLQAALLSMGAEGAAKGVGGAVKQAPETIKQIPQKTQEAASNIKEFAGETTGGALESTADLLSKAHVPGAQQTIGALGAYMKYLSKNPEKYAEKQLFKEITPELMPLINERLEAAQRLGLSYLTPAEATLSPFEAGKQGKIGQTAEGSRKLFAKGRQRSASEEQSIENLKQKIYDPKDLDPQKQAAYEQAMSATVPEEFMEKWSEDPLVAHAIKQIDTKPTYKRAVRGIPKNSFEYWNIVKRVIGDMEKGEAKGMQKFSSDEATKARNEMVGEMDKIQPEYSVARKIAEREFTRQKIDDYFDKRNVTGNEFAKLMKSKKEFNKLMDKLEPYPEAQQHLKDMKLIFGDLIPTDPSIRTAAQMEKTSMWGARNKLDAYKRDLDQRFGEQHDVASVNLMTDPRWIDALVKHLAKQKGKK